MYIEPINTQTSNPMAKEEELIIEKGYKIYDNDNEIFYDLKAQDFPESNDPKEVLAQICWSMQEPSDDPDDHPRFQSKQFFSISFFKNFIENDCQNYEEALISVSGVGTLNYMDCIQIWENPEMYLPVKDRVGELKFMVKPGEDDPTTNMNALGFPTGEETYGEYDDVLANKRAVFLEAFANPEYSLKDSTPEEREEFIIQASQLISEEQLTTSSAVNEILTHRDCPIKIQPEEILKAWNMNGTLEYFQGGENKTVMAKTEEEAKEIFIVLYKDTIEGESPTPVGDMVFEIEQADEDLPLNRLIKTKKDCEKVLNKLVDLSYHHPFDEVGGLLQQGCDMDKVAQKVHKLDTFYSEGYSDIQEKEEITPEQKKSRFEAGFFTDDDLSERGFEVDEFGAVFEIKDEDGEGGLQYDNAYCAPDGQQYQMVGDYEGGYKWWAKERLIQDWEEGNESEEKELEIIKKAYISVVLDDDNFLETTRVISSSIQDIAVVEKLLATTKSQSKGKKR